MQWNIKNIDMITIKHLLVNQILAFNDRVGEHLEYDTRMHLMVRLHFWEIWEVWSTPSLLLLSDPL